MAYCLTPQQSFFRGGASPYRQQQPGERQFPPSSGIQFTPPSGIPLSPPWISTLWQEQRLCLCLWEVSGRISDWLWDGTISPYFPWGSDWCSPLTESNRSFRLPPGPLYCLQGALPCQDWGNIPGKTQMCGFGWEHTHHLPWTLDCTSHSQETQRSRPPNPQKALSERAFSMAYSDSWQAGRGRRRWILKCLATFADQPLGPVLLINQP